MVTENGCGDATTEQSASIDHLEKSPCIILVNVDNKDQLSDVVDAAKTSHMLVEHGQYTLQLSISMSKMNNE